MPFTRASVLMAIRPGECPMKRDTLRKSLWSIFVPLSLGLLMAWTAAFAGTPAPPSEPKVQRLIFVSAEFNKGNRFCPIGPSFHLQFDPYLETLLDLGPNTCDYVPRLAEKSESSPDKKE